MDKIIYDRIEELARICITSQEELDFFLKRLSESVRRRLAEKERAAAMAGKPRPPVPVGVFGPYHFTGVCTFEEMGIDPSGEKGCREIADGCRYDDQIPLCRKFACEIGWDRGRFYTEMRAAGCGNFDVYFCRETATLCIPAQEALMTLTPEMDRRVQETLAKRMRYK